MPSHGRSASMLAGMAFADSVAADGDVVSIIEEPADYPLNLWDEKTSPLSQRSLSFHFVQLGARARSGDAAALGFYRDALDWLTAQAEAGAIKAPAVRVVGPLGAIAAREARTRLATRHAATKLVMTVEE